MLKPHKDFFIFLQKLWLKIKRSNNVLFGMTHGHFERK
jgi:hypothetical protein